MDKQAKEDWQLQDHLDQLSDDAQGFLRTKRDMLILDVAERTGVLSAKAVMLLVGLAVVGMTMLFASLGLAHWLSVEFGDPMKGYLSVAGIYLLLGFALWLVWKYRLRDMIILNMVNEMYHDR